MDGERAWGEVFSRTDWGAGLFYWRLAWCFRGGLPVSSRIPRKVVRSIMPTETELSETRTSANDDEKLLTKEELALVRHDPDTRVDPRNSPYVPVDCNSWRQPPSRHPIARADGQCSAQLGKVPVMLWASMSLQTYPRAYNFPVALRGS